MAITLKISANRPSITCALPPFTAYLWAQSLAFSSHTGARTIWPDSPETGINGNPVDKENLLHGKRTEG
jgi:hypothetical protein